MPSDLATALLSGQGSALAADPAFAQVIPQLSLAQAMTQSGLSGEPAYPAQALGRLASTLAGIKMMDEATGQLSGVYGHAANSMAKIFPEDTPLGRALRSDDPYTRMIAMREAAKVMVINSEKTTLGPAQTSNLPTGGAGTPVAQGSPPMAGAVKAAEAPYEAGGEGTITGPSGYTEKVPITAAERAAAGAARAQPRPQVQAAPPQPGSTAPIVPKPVTPVIVRAPLITGNPAGAAKPPIEGAPLPGGKDQSRAPTAPQVGGVPFGPEYEGRVESEKAANKEFMEKSTPSYEAAQNLMGRLTVMDHNIDALGPRWMGAGANAKGEFGKAWNSMLDSANVKGFHIDPNKIATWEEFNKESTRAGMELIKSNFGGSREAASIIQMGASAVPSAQQSYLGAKYNAASIKAATQREIDLHEFKSYLLTQGKSLIGADAAFNKARPPEQYAMKGITDVIPASAKQHLAANPKLAPDFDKKYGAGTAEFLLGTR